MRYRGTHSRDGGATRTCKVPGLPRGTARDYRSRPFPLPDQMRRAILARVALNQRREFTADCILQEPRSFTTLFASKIRVLDPSFDILPFNSTCSPGLRSVLPGIRE